MEWLFVDGVAPFSLALLVMFGLGLIEIIGLVFGASMTAHFHHDLPDLHHHPDVHLDVNAGHGLASVLGWLQIGRAPLLILLVLFLLGFGLSGIILQQMWQQWFGSYLYGGIVAIPSTLIGMYQMRIGGKLAQKYLPRDQTESVSTDSFIGQTVSITVGEARAGHPAEAKFKDQFGLTHYVMVEPENPLHCFGEGTTALIIRKDGEIYRVVPDINYLLANTRTI